MYYIKTFPIVYTFIIVKKELTDTVFIYINKHTWLDQERTINV
jgi:hypothetical protein